MRFHDIFNIYTLLVIEISEIVYGKVFTSKNRNAPSKTSNIIQLCVAKWDINMSRALSIYFVRLISCLVTLMHSSTIYMHISMTSLLTHTFKSCVQLSQKLDVILEHKVVQKLQFPKNVNNKMCAPKIKFFNEKKVRKIRILF